MARIFISHIVAEAPVAIALKAVLLDAFGEQVKVFVASDGQSIGGGQEWWQRIREEVKEADVTLILLSSMSVVRPWVNYEAGIADGGIYAQDILVRIIPIAIRNFTFDKLDFPLKGFQGRFLGNLQGLFLDLSSHGLILRPSFDFNDAIEKLSQAENDVNYKACLITPYMVKSSDYRFYLRFEISNVGTVDLDLLLFEVLVPSSLFAYEQPIDQIGISVYIDRDWVTITLSATGPKPFLRQVLTPSMGIVKLNEIGIPLNVTPQSELSEYINFRLHARNYTADMELVH